MNTLTTGKRIVVLGGGYAGVLAAQRAAGKTRGTGARVALVNAAPNFVERIRLHELSAGRPSVSVPLSELLEGTGVELVVGRATSLDLGHREVTVEASGERRVLPFDALVYAVGSVGDAVSTPGVSEHAHGIGSHASALALCEALVRLRVRGGQVLVAGGGLSGIEAAAEIAEAHPALTVTLVTRGAIGPGLSARGRAHIRGALAEMGVALLEQTALSELREGRALLEGGGDLPFDVCVWTAGFGCSPLAREAGLLVDEAGRVQLDAELRSLSHPFVYGAGDAAAVATGAPGPLRMSCAAGMPMGAQAADNVAAWVRGGPQAPLRFAFSGQCISLGRRRGLVQMVRHDDAPVDRIIGGRLGALVKELICRYTLWSLRLSRRIPGAYAWPTPAPPGGRPPSRLEGRA